ncbi:PA14 domain-containing protein [Haliangium sp.]|uniref:PA14 domain-containing protein n=1 Tax=Haliangium sp. TaxID=2663208 RepID=UPI003D11E757
MLTSSRIYCCVVLVLGAALGACEGGDALPVEEQASAAFSCTDCVITESGAQAAAYQWSLLGYRTDTGDAHDWWHDTGVDLNTGDVVSLSCTGGIRSWPDSRPFDCNGDPGNRWELAIAGTACDFASLVGKIGTEGVPFCIGAAGVHTVPAGGGGRLHIGFNDGVHFADNSGSWLVLADIEHASACGGGGWHDCSPECPCPPGEGDCDSDADCVSDTFCLHDAGLAFGFDDAEIDVCSDICPTLGVGARNYCSEQCPCAAGEGDCDGDVQCLPGLACASDIGAAYGFEAGVDVCVDECEARSPGSFHYCSAACPCAAGEGDCDGGDECRSGLTCVRDVGAEHGYEEEVDVCLDTCHPSAVGGWHYCSPGCPCSADEGDCDSDDDCIVGLVCTKNIGARYGYPAGVDMCRPSYCPITQVVGGAGSGPADEADPAVRSQVPVTCGEDEIDMLDYMFHDEAEVNNRLLLTALDGSNPCQEEGGADVDCWQPIRAYMDNTRLNHFFVVKQWTGAGAEEYEEYRFDDEYIYLIRDTSWQPDQWPPSGQAPPPYYNTSFELWRGGVPGGIRFPRCVFLERVYEFSNRILIRFEGIPSDRCAANQEACSIAPEDQRCLVNGAHQLHDTRSPWRFSTRMEDEIQFSNSDQTIADVLVVEAQLDDGAVFEEFYFHQELGWIGYRDIPIPDRAIGRVTAEYDGPVQGIGGIAALTDQDDCRGLYPNYVLYYAEYFDSRSDLEGGETPMVTRYEEESDGFLSYDWGTGSPQGIDLGDDFAVRWTGQAYFEAGTYLFETSNDDGLRLMVGGALVIDDWRDHSVRDNTRAHTFDEAGMYEILIEYYDAQDDAVIRADWRKIDC